MQSPRLDASHDDSFRRLAKLQGSDCAFFVLAVHSFIEGAIKASIPVGELENDSFKSALTAFSLRVSKRLNRYTPQMSCIQGLRQQHDLTNKARHSFGTAGEEDARTATKLLKDFCHLAGIPETESLQAVIANLKAWDERRCVGDLVKELYDIGYRYQLEKKSSKEMAERVKALETSLAERDRVQASIDDKDREIAALTEAKGKKDAKLDELRKRQFELERERALLAADLKGAREKAAAYDDAQFYLETLSRMTVLTRTRSDYERSLVRLTPEQKKVLGQIALDSDFLVKGAAGTGKSLVLLKAMERLQKGPGMEGDSLGLQELKGSAILLTYTKTLVSYDQYLASILAGESFKGRLQTADQYLQERLREADPSAQVRFDIHEELAKDFPVEGLSARELAFEAESFVWGNAVSREEYLEEGIERKGMKRALSKEQRKVAWEAIEGMARRMEERRTYSRSRAACLLAEAIASGCAPAVKRFDYSFIDEAQDLPAAFLRAIKACTNRSVILAGDADQSIYQPGFTFKRAGIDIAGRARVLRTNFRNTVQLHELAERYRALSTERDAENQPEAYRQGPAPELFEAADEKEMLELLEGRVELFLKVLGYAPENLCVVAPGRDDVAKVEAHLAVKGFRASDIHADGYDFSGEGSIRITTMHSAKGLDFPVVLLYVPHFHVVGGGQDKETSDRMARNLLYVAMTRAMDHLNVFIREGTDNKSVVDLAKCFEGLR
jgi:superfamily I DNA/RNA helicase